MKDLDERDRFRRKIEVDSTTGCHNFTGALVGTGYGHFKVGDRRVLAHRFAYEKTHGPIPIGQELHHLCGNKRCANPDHLRPITHAEHMVLTSQTLPKKTHCIRGHEFTEANTYHRGNDRICRECRRIHNKAHKSTESYRAKRREKRRMK